MAMWLKKIIQKHIVCKVLSCLSLCLHGNLDAQDIFYNMALKMTVSIVKHSLLLMVSPWCSQSSKLISFFITSDFWDFYKFCFLKGWRMCHLSKTSIQYVEGILFVISHKDKWNCLWLEFDGHLQLWLLIFWIHS